MDTRQFLSNPSPDDLPRTADVIVIGGGPAGTAILWALHRAAPHLKTILIEATDRIGAGSSLASLENYRTCWPAVCLARQVGRSIDIFHDADEYLGEGAADSLHLREQGYLFVAFTPSYADAMRQDVAHLHDIGITHVEYLDYDEVHYRFPWLDKSVIAAKFDPIAGWLDSNALIHRYVRSAPSAKVLLDIPNTEIRIKNGAVAGVATIHGDIDAPNVVIAAGAGSILVGRTAGVELPIVMRPRQSFTTPWRHATFPSDAPMLIAPPPCPHVRPEAGTGAIFGFEYHWNSKHIAQNGMSVQDHLIDPIFPTHQLKDPRFPSITLALLARFFRHADGEGFAHSRYLQGISHNIGYYVSRGPDAACQLDENGDSEPYESERAILDAVPDIDGLFVSIAHVGHGIMSSPAAGEIIAAKILGEPLGDPTFTDFGFDAKWVEYDNNAL